MEKERENYKELALVIMEAERSHNLLPTRGGPREMMVQRQSKSEALETGALMA